MAAESHTIGRREGIDIGLGSALQQLKSDFGLDDRGLADALGVDRRTLTRWMAAETYPQKEARGRLRKLIDLHSVMLLMWSSPQAARAWLHRPSPFLGQTEPIELVQRGRFDRVEAALEAINSGFAS